MLKAFNVSYKNISAKSIAFLVNFGQVISTYIQAFLYLKSIKIVIASQLIKSIKIKSKINYMNYIYSIVRIDLLHGLHRQLSQFHNFIFALKICNDKESKNLLFLWVLFATTD